jgi:hypothetical protein
LNKRVVKVGAKKSNDRYLGTEGVVAWYKLTLVCDGKPHILRSFQVLLFKC